MHPLLKPKTPSDATLSFQFWLIVVPGTGLAAAVLSVLSFAVSTPFDGWTP